MKHKKKTNLFVRTFLFLAALILILIAAAIGFYYYMFSIPEPEGLSLAQWPQVFTNSFSVWATYENGEVTVEEIGLARLEEYGLWIQFIDESGQEIFSYHKPADYPAKYTASELIAFRTSPYEKGHTVFVGQLEDSGEVCSYLVGFPYDIGKYMLYYNGARIARLSPTARMVMILVFSILIISVLGYVFWLSRKLSKMTEGIRTIASHTYQPLRENGVFREVFCGLNKMNAQIQYSDQVQADTERLRGEWIANITHDLKTPLSPVKGYAELLADGAASEEKTIQEYGSIILKNVDHAEKMINDLKLTYQLDSGSVPFHPREVRLVRCLKEWLIDIMNDPAFARRNITLESHIQELVVRIDPELFRRVVQNLIINALIHNPPDTKITVTIDSQPQNGLSISIRDNGVGISEVDQSELFNRYYRGTNTKEKPEGSGLGLAIAKQIVVLHGGTLTVHSKMQEGTEFIIFLPCN